MQLPKLPKSQTSPLPPPSLSPYTYWMKWPTMFPESLQLFGDVHTFGFSSPRILRFSPFGTWFVALPVWIATQFQGWGEAQRIDGVDGHVVPVLIVYPGRQPNASSWYRFE